MFTKCQETSSPRILNANWSCFRTSMPNTVLDPINCMDVATTTSTADSLVMWEDNRHSCHAWFTTWRINRCSSSSLVMSWLNSLNSSQPRRPPLSTDEFSLSCILFWFSVHLSDDSRILKRIIVRPVWQGCRGSLNCKLPQTGPLLQYCSIISHLPFVRLCRDSVENLHPVCYIKLVQEQSQTCSFIWKIPQVVF